MKTVTKFILANSLIAILTIFSFALFSLHRLHEEEAHEAKEDLERCMGTFWELLRDKGEGFSVVDGKLLAGNYVVNDNFEVPDRVQKIFGGVATVFLGDTRIATNVLQADGSRAVGTRLEGPAFDAIFKEGKPYRGEALILGIPYLTAYDPIRDGRGKIVGANFVGVKKGEVLQHFSALRTQLTLTLFALMAAFMTLMVLLARMAKKFEKTKEEQKEFAESLVQNSTVPTFVLDSRHRVISWNRACEEVTGIKAAAVLGTDEQWKAFYDHKRPLLADFALDGTPEEAIRDYYRSFAKSNVLPEGLQAEDWFPAMNGCDRFLSFSAAPIRDSRGELVAAIENFEEITGRRKAVEKTDQALSTLRATLEATADGILVTDLEGKIVAYNRKFAEMWQLPESILDSEVEEQVLLLVLRQVKDPDAYAAQARKHYDRPETEDRYEFEFSDGRIFERYSKPQRIGEAIVGRVRSYRDISEQRKLESQLRHSQKMEAIGTLAGGVAHDFNNILTAITGYGSLLEMRLGENDPSRPFVEHILSAADRAATLTKSLLTFSRKQNLEMRVVELNSVVLDVEKLLLRLMREDIELRTTLADAPCMVLADAGQIGQVLMNLATNARDAMPKGGTLTLRIAMTRLEDDFVAIHGYGAAGSYALLTVTDTGAGMDAETRNRIFEPFFTTKEVGKGTGLGLSMAYGIVKQHNGFITCDSEPGAGTTFRIYLPTNGGEGRRPGEGICT